MNNDEQQLEDPPTKKVVKTANFRVKTTLIVKKHLQKKLNRLFSIRRMLTPKCFITSQKNKEKLLRKLKL